MRENAFFFFFFVVCSVLITGRIAVLFYKAVKVKRMPDAAFVY